MLMIADIRLLRRGHKGAGRWELGWPVHCNWQQMELGQTGAVIVLPVNNQ